MITISNKNLVLVCLFVISATFVLGWLLGRLTRDNASNTFISIQNDIIKEYLYDLDHANKEIDKKDIVIAVQKQIIQESFVKKEELDSIITVQNNKLSKIEEKVNEILTRPDVIIVLPAEHQTDTILLSKTFCEQNSLNKKGGLAPPSAFTTSFLCHSN